MEMDIFLSASSELLEICFKLFVISMLLIISGIETNPGPLMDEDLPAQYTKTAGFANMTGELYEVKISGLEFLRALQNHKEFHITSNMQAAGSFDDVILTLDNRTTFLQLKHKENEKYNITMSELLRVKGNFSLFKYCKSFLEMKAKWTDDDDLKWCGRFEDSQFIVFTNASLPQGIGVDVTANNHQDLINTGGKCFSFEEEHDTNIYHVFENLPRYKEMFSAPKNYANDDILQALRNLHYSAKEVPSKDFLRKLADELESLGDLSGYKEFLLQLRFYTEQESEKYLDKLIKQELEALLGTDEMFAKFITGVQNWWKNSNSYLTKNIHFWQEIVETYAAKIFKVKLDMINKIDVKFKEHECKILRNKLMTTGNILYLKTQCTLLSCAKILQSFGTKAVVDLITLKSRLKEVLAVWKLGTWGDILVVEGWTDCKELSSILENFADKKVVVLCEKSHHVDIFSLYQLEEESQKKILDHSVISQGYSIKLRSIAHNTVPAEVVVKLMTENCTLEIGTALDSIEEFYISRTLLCRNIVSDDIFSAGGNFYLAVSGLSVKDLQQLVASGEKVMKFHTNRTDEMQELDYAQCKYFIIRDEIDFQAISKLYTNIHWIHRSDNGFVWRQSNQDLTPVLQFLTNKTTSLSSEEVLQRAMIIVAQAGMGKSIELTHVATEIKCKDPTIWVIRMDLREHKYPEHGKINVIQLLSAAANFKSVFERSLLEYELNHGGNVAVLMDGFDEISPKYSDQVLQLLRELLVTNVKHIWVTSRHTMRLQLEEELCTLSYDLKSFTKDEQEKFLLKFWSVSVDDCHGFILALINLAENTLGNRTVEFMGIPLQIRMLAEIFKSEAMDYRISKEINLPPKLDLLVLYRRFVDKIWSIYCVKMKLDTSNAITEDMYEQTKKQTENDLMYCALVTLLDDLLPLLSNSQKIQEQNDNFVATLEKAGDRRGIIIHVRNGRAMFFHQTFAEYFAALWFSYNYKTDLEVFRHVYIDEKFEIVRHFFDRILCENFDLHIAVLNHDKHMITAILSSSKDKVNEKDSGGRTSLHLAIANSVNHNYTNDYNDIITVLLDNGADCNIADDVLHWTPLRMAEEIRAWSAVGLLLEKQPDQDLVVIPQKIKKEYRFLDEVLRTVAKHGFIELTSAMLNCGVKVQTLITDDFYNFGFGYDHNYFTFLHLAAINGQYQLVKFLIEHDADINCTNIWGETPLMMAGRFGKLEVVKLLCELGATTTSALIFAIMGGHLQVVECLVKHNADLSVLTGIQDSLLHVASRNGHLDIVEYLIKQGADVSAVNKTQDTALHLACENGYARIVDHLLQHGANPLACNALRHTPLHLAANKCHFDVVDCLLNYKPDLTAVIKYEIQHSI